MSYPFEQTELSSYKLKRTFSVDVDNDELVWHRDKEDRLIKVIQGGGWRFQLDEKIPIILENGYSYFIPKNFYHRVLKGSKDLIIEIDLIY